jgi:hypothetical protein
MPASKHQAMPNGACVKFFLVMFGQTAEYSRLRASHFSAPRSVLGLMASTGHSGSHATLPYTIHPSSRAFAVAAAKALARKSVISLDMMVGASQL